MSGDNVVLGPVTLTTGGNLSASGHLNAGTYAGIEQVSSISGTDIGNYTFAGLTGSYTVTPATLMVTYTATAASTTYGVAPGALTGTYTATGLVDGDNLGGSAAFTSSVSATTHVGTYAITGSGITADSNYTLTSVQAAGNATALAVNPASLTITYTATPLTRNAGTTPTGLTGTSNAVGLVNGDTLSGTAAFTTPATAASPAGSYAINGSGLTASSDYTLTAVQAPGNATALTLLKPPATAQSLATYVQDVIPVYHPFMTLRPCEPLKVSRVYRTDGQVVLTRVQGGGDCPLPAMP